MRDQVGIIATPLDPIPAVPGRIEVYDLAGRWIVGLAGDAWSGVAWDGRDESGRAVPAGLYFGRVPGVSSTARILVVR